MIIEAIKLGVPDLTETHPLEGIETNLVAWAVAALILSLAGDGFLAELATNRQGHPWVPHLGSQCGHSFHAVGSVARTARSAVSFVGSTSAYLMEDAFKSISDNVHIDTDYLDQTVEQTLRDTDIEQLQLEYLQGQVNAVVNDITDAGDAIVVDGQDAKVVAQNTDLNEAEVD